MPGGHERFNKYDRLPHFCSRWDCLYQMKKKNCKREFENCMGLPKWCGRRLGLPSFAAKHRKNIHPRYSEGYADVRDIGLRKHTGRSFPSNDGKSVHLRKCNNKGISRGSRTFIHGIPRATQTSGILGFASTPDGLSPVTTESPCTCASAITKGSPEDRFRLVSMSRG